MTKEEIHKLIREGRFSGDSGTPELVETHISWVILCDAFAYKIKKPIRYSFLDFSDLEKRKYYCEREIILNKRLTDGIYVDVQPVRKHLNMYSVNTGRGDIIDYAVRMRKMDRSLQMNVLLANNKVTEKEIQDLARKIAVFHKGADIIYEKDLMDIRNKFNDLENETGFLYKYLNAESGALIHRAVAASDKFLEDHSSLIASRLQAGFYRDGHGDLHSRNIFLLPAPQVFDCIEFNDDFRQTDVLNEIAFLCMDLDAYGRQDLSDLFLTSYSKLFPSIRIPEDKMLFIYYKSYRSNIRAKVNSLRAKDARNSPGGNRILSEVAKYLSLMSGYLKEIE